MTTKLEMMVGYLSGRQGKGAEWIRQELEDPTSESSRWLEAVQKRSQAVCRIGLPNVQTPASPPEMRKGMAMRGSRGKWLLPFLSGFSVASLLFIATGVAWRAQDTRLLRLETTLTEREDRWATRFGHLNEVLTTRKAAPAGNKTESKQSASPQAKLPATADGQTVLALARIEARLGDLEERLGEARSSQTQTQTDPMITELRTDVDRLRRDMENRAQSSSQQSLEMKMVLQEVLQLLRRLASGPWVPGPMQVPVPQLLQEHQRHGVPEQGMMPGAEQLPGQGQMTDRDHSLTDPGQINRERGNQGFSGGYTGPGMQRPGGLR